MPNPTNHERTLPQEMQITAQTGDLALLQTQLAQWESQVSAPNQEQEQHNLSFKPTLTEQVERAYMADRTGKAGPLYDLLSRLLVQAARTNQAAVARYILGERGGFVTPMAVRRGMAASAFDVLEVFRECGWQVNEPVQDGRCPILGWVKTTKNKTERERWRAKADRFVTNNEARVRWCLERGADPNARNKNKYMDVPSQAGRYASVSVLQLLAAHGANFRCSNALQRAAEAESESAGRMEVLQWLLDEAGFPINQREFEYDPEEFHKWWGNGLGTALHYAVYANSPERVRFLLERGCGANLKDTLGRTARELCHEERNAEVIAILDTWGSDLFLHGQSLWDKG